jgi:hypothetical protein
MLEAHREAISKQVEQLEETAAVLDRKIEIYTEMEKTR